MNAISGSVWVGETRWGQLSPWWRRVIAEIIDGISVAFVANMLLLVMGEHTWWGGPHGYVLGTDC